ncbi:NCS2 family permease [Luteimicrobium subarcticum]|uniref:AGZA family xanthine/uracil permease-like MFS transporter n=1 Tax=Luteimicrobium subarcticum TaxID=620910 RepID=A0A2M8WSV0_9MICO|nr:NCS2 family permease [Luteimicrobium subarcticum]PJI94009.1 AGZA family xanthine/uracil permease-like MFS transporter [Luteimicrobium subarcticum]
MTSTAPARPSALDRYFRISERGSTVGTEIRGGLVTFFAMCYIIALNPLILGTVKDGTGHFLADGNLAVIAAATSLVAGVMTILMGVVANFPLSIAAGLGLNAVVAFSIAARPGVSWADAMGLVVLEGVVMLALVLTGFRTAMFRAVPQELKVAISVGIGMFIALVGFVDSGFVRAGGGTPLSLGIDGSLAGWPILIFVIGLVLLLVLMIRKVRGAILIAIAAATILAVAAQSLFHVGAQGADGSNPRGWSLNVPSFPGWGNLVDVPDLSIVGHFSLTGGIRELGILTVVLLVFSLVIADFFDTMGTMVAVGSEGKLLDAEGNPVGTKKILVVDSVAAMAGGVGSVSSNTAFVESTTGVGDGARTGLSSVVTGVAFLLSMFAAPLVSMVPSEAAAPALVLVGFLMMTQVAGIDWKHWELAIPAFLTIVLMPFTYSITTGMGAGFIAYVILQVAVGKARKVHPLLWIAAAAFVVYFALGPIEELLNA